MRVLICCPIPEFADAYGVAAKDAAMPHAQETNIQELGSQLFRDPDAIGLLWAAGAASAEFTVKEMRRADIKNLLVVLLEQPGDLEREALNRIKVLTAGADDVQPASIDMRELTMRLKAVSRRGSYLDHRLITLPKASFNVETRQLEGQEATLRLTPAEAILLVELARRPGIIMNKRDLMNAVYSGTDADEPGDKVVDVRICKIRRKIMRVTGGLDVIETHWGRGYTFVPEGFVPKLDSVRRKAVPA